MRNSRMMRAVCLMTKRTRRMERREYPSMTRRYMRLILRRMWSSIDRPVLLLI